MLQIFYKLIYNQHVNFLLRSINKFLLPIIPSKIRIPPSGVITIKVNHNKKIKIKTNQTSFITSLLYWDGGPNRFEYTEVFLKLINSVSVFYDVGANIGYYSLIAGIVNENIKVVAFEPAMGSTHFLNENVRINKLSNVFVYPIALSNIQDGEIKFYEVTNSKYTYLKHNLAGEGNTGSKTEGREFKINEVKTTTLDGFVKSENEKQIDLIKMDTEGTENLILENADLVLSEMKPIIICEILYDFIESELEDIFKRYGYEFYCHVQGGLRKQDTITRTTDDGIRNCFFVHPSKLHLIEDFLVI